eukprot:1156954-Prorocentrum_minimum.AAC.3
MHFEHFPLSIGYMEVPACRGGEGGTEGGIEGVGGGVEGPTRVEYVGVQLAVLRVLLTHTLAYAHASVRKGGRRAPEVSKVATSLMLAHA